MGIRDAHWEVRTAWIAGPEISCLGRATLVTLERHEVEILKQQVEVCFRVRAEKIVIRSQLPRSRSTRNEINAMYPSEQ